MSDFAGGIRRSVQAARELAKQQQAARRRHDEEESTRQKQNEQRVAELPELIWGRIRDAEDAGDGAIKVERTRGTGRTTFQVSWQEGQPDRALHIVVDEGQGVIQASWVVAPQHGQSVDAPSVEAFRFDLAQLEAAIELLVDQRRWGRGIIPMIPW
ncbi:MAG: hypothetical protein H0V51_13390 [Chloroflexi bacterium]|nr:hypothetical protein [Chloroflexota bacterium]